MWKFKITVYDGLKLEELLSWAAINQESQDLEETCKLSGLEAGTSATITPSLSDSQTNQLPSAA